MAADAHDLVELFRSRDSPSRGRRALSVREVRMSDTDAPDRAADDGDEASDTAAARQGSSSAWLEVEPAPFHRLVPDVIDDITEFLPWRDQLSFRASCRKVAVQSAAMWAAAAVAIKEEWGRGAKDRAVDVAAGVGKTVAGTVATGATVAAMVGSVVYGGPKGARLAASLSGLLAPSASLAAGGVRATYNAVSDPLCDRNGIIASERAWRPKDHFVFAGAACDGEGENESDDEDEEAAEGPRQRRQTRHSNVDVIVVVERQRYSPLFRSWSVQHLLPLDPPAFESPQLGLPGPGNPVAHIRDVTDITQHGEGNGWSWDGPWRVVPPTSTASPPPPEEQQQEPQHDWWQTVSRFVVGSDDPNATAADGWRYGMVFAGGLHRLHGEKRTTDVVRERTWHRTMAFAKRQPQR